MIILEMQDGKMCQNKKTIVKKLIDSALQAGATPEKVMFKWQLYTNLKSYVDLIPLQREVFDYAYSYAKKLGFKTIASYFDNESYEFLKQYEMPYYKIACQTELYDFRKEMHKLIKAGDNVLLSVENEVDFNNMYCQDNITLLSCIPKYPATKREYESKFSIPSLKMGISDHTVGLELYNKYKPQIYETHYYIEGLESWDKEWSITPKDLKEIL